MTENTRAPRIKTSMAVAFSKDGDFLCANIMNISCSGVFIKTEPVLPVDTELALRIRLPEDLETMDSVGRVAWAKEASCASPAGMGIEFLRTSSKDRKKIHSCVESSLRKIQKVHEGEMAEEATLL